MKQVQEWLGYSTYQTTADIYVHLDYSSKLSAASDLMNVFGNSEQLKFHKKLLN